MNYEFGKVYVPYSVKATVREHLSLQNYEKMVMYLSFMPHSLRLKIMPLNCTFKVHYLMFLLKINSSFKLNRFVKQYHMRYNYLQDIVQQKYLLKHNFIILETQSGVINEKEMRRSLFRNSKASKKKAKIRQKMSDLSRAIEKRPKDTNLQHKMVQLTKDLEIQVGWKDIPWFKKDCCEEGTIGHIENMMSYFVAVSECVSIKQFICITNLYLGCWFSSSRISLIISYFKQLFFDHTKNIPFGKWKNDLEEKIEDIRDNFEIAQTSFNVIREHGISRGIDEILGNAFDIEDSDNDDDLEVQTGILSDIKQMLSSWKDLKNCESARKLYKFVSYILAMGLCESNNLTFSLGKFEIFHIAASKDSHMNFTDILEMMFETIIYFIERGYQAFKSGDPWQLLYGDDKLLEYEKTFSYLNSYIAVIENGNLEALDESVDSFEEKVSVMKDLTIKMLQDRPSPSYRQLLNVKLGLLDKIYVRLIQSRKNVSIREKPYSILLFGSSGVGKSAMTNIILNQLMQVNGFDPSPLKINSLNASDQYQSDYRSDATCVIFDDLANATLATAKGNHCQLLIDFINNNPKCALKAGVEEKGACPIKPKIVLGTTNVKTLLAHQYSNEPVSIVRRFDVTISVFVKEQYRKDDSPMIDIYKVPSGCKDCWLFDVEQVVSVERGTGATAGIGYKPVMFNNEPLVQIDMKKLLQYLTFSSQKHFLAQKDLVARSHEIFKESLCKQCNQYIEFCECLEVQVKPIPDEIKNIGNFNVSNPDDDKNILVPFWFKKLNCLGETIGQVYDKTKIISNFIQNIEEYAGVENIHSFHQNIKEKYPYITYIVIWPVISIMFLFGFVFSSTYIFFFCILSLIKLMKFWNYWAEKKLKMFALKDNALVLYKKYNTEQNRKYIKIGAVGIVSVVAIRKIYNLFRAYNILRIQGSECVTPIPQSDEKPQNEWKKPYITPIPKSTKSWTTTSQNLVSMVSDNIAYFEYTVLTTGKKYFSNAFPLKSNLWLINNHALVDGSELHAKFVRHDISLQGGNFSTKISPFHTVHIPETDLALIYVPTGGDNKNMIDYFPLEFKNIKTPATLINREDNGIITTQLINAKPGYNSTGDINVIGYGYKTEKPTYKGLCMATLVSDEIGPMILGFHFAGNTGGRIGAATSVTQAQLLEACNILSLRTGVLLSHNTGDLTLNDVGPYKNVSIMGEIHDKSPLNYQPDGATFRALGKHNGIRKTYKSDVEPSLISDTVATIMGQQNIWGPPPNLKGWQTWQRDLSNMTHPKELSPTMVVCAVKDYQATILANISLERIKRISPLSDEAALSGADGVYGIDSVNMKSSCGAPINKPKNKILIRSDIPIKGISQPIIAPDYIWDEVKRIESELLQGNRVYLQFTACLKDEPTKITKLKTRVFCGSPIAASILIRKYYLPFCKLIMENNEVFECAVGVNAHGNDWDRLTKHIIRFGKDNMVAGDYSDYDSTMPAALMLASFRIIIDLARIAGYSSNQIIIMEGLATEMCYPFYEYNGEFIQIQGSNPSGHPLTVFTNSICNSLYMRFAYYHIYDFDNKTLFKDYVSLMTYGDDNIMSVSEERPNFNHTKIAEVLANYDIKYTMADKSTISRPFISLNETSFLKRSFKFSDEFGLYIAPIEELSLFKTLHSALRSKELTREQHSAQAIDCVLREWFFYGKEHFNEKRVQLIEVAKKHRLLHHFEDNELHTYESLKSSFINKYLTQDINPESDPQVGGMNVHSSSTLII